MKNRILWASIFGILGIVFLPHLKEPIETTLSFSGAYPDVVQLFVDHIYLVMFVIWVVIILLILFWRRKSSNENEIESQ